MLKVQKSVDNFKYNELVIDSEVWRNALPNTIGAFFYPVNDTTCDDGCKKFVRDAHSDFLRYYNGKNGRPAKYVPLLKLDRLDMGKPFSLDTTDLNGSGGLRSVLPPPSSSPLNTPLNKRHLSLLTARSC
jgi:hypothetical protein